MALKPGDIARGTLAIALPVAGGALATYGELLWGAAAVAVLAAVPPARRYAAAAGAVFGLLVLGRAGALVPARGVTAVLLGLAAIAAVAYVLALRRPRGRRVADARWALALGAAAAVAAAGAAYLVAPPTVNLVLVPLAALAALAAPATGDRLPRAAFAALAIGLALGAVKGAAGFALTGRADAALARGDYAGAERYASYAAALAPGGRADLVRLMAAAESGAPWDRLEAIYKRRDRFASPRPFDAALARAALVRGDYEKAAMYGDLATTPSPTSPVRDKPVAREELYASFAAAVPPEPFAHGWVAAWGGRYDEAAAAFEEAAENEPRAELYRALALERAGRREAAAALYGEMWGSDWDDFAAAFGLLRTANYHGLRGTIWRTIRIKYPKVIVGAKLDAGDGFALSKHRLSLGRTPATFLCKGKGRRGIAVIAESYAAEGLFPIVELSVNGRPARTIYMNVPGENIYELSVELDAERDEIGLLFINDYADEERGVDRNVYVREVRLSGERDKR
jgi:tetratricopeptide (TPR) repeat protein